MEKDKNSYFLFIFLEECWGDSMACYIKMPELGQNEGLLKSKYQSACNLHDCKFLHPTSLKSSEITDKDLSYNWIIKSMMFLLQHTVHRGTRNKKVAPGHTILCIKENLVQVFVQPRKSFYKLHVKINYLWEMVWVHFLFCQHLMPML